MPKKPKIEYRITCANFGDRHHRTHQWIKNTKVKAQQSVTDLNHHAEMAPATHYYKREAPYVIERREVTAWEKVEK